MRWATRTALAGVFVASVATVSAYATASEGTAAARADASTAQPSLDSVAGQKLISIDGSLIALTPSEGGMAREIVAPNGAVQHTSFRFITDRLGTVTDSRDTGKVTGVFRMSNADIEIQYADGSSETVLANASGGISIEMRSPMSGPYCTAWYPENHVFTLDDRKAALAQYASRLGIPDAGDKKSDVQSRSGCSSAPLAHASDARAKSEAGTAEVAVRPAFLAGAALAAGAKPAAPKTAALAAAATHAIDVRTSEVHTIDGNPAAEPQQPQIVASLDLNQGTVAPNQKGASSCLSVETDGSHWGFRNRCDYSVQFAYCLLNGAALASCRDGAVAGSVAGNGFGALVADESLKDSDVAHDFRWVACQGGAGEVIPHLDDVNPPSGRCVR